MKAIFKNRILNCKILTSLFLNVMFNINLFFFVIQATKVILVTIRAATIAVDPWAVVQAVAEVAVVLVLPAAAAVAVAVAVAAIVVIKKVNYFIYKYFI